MFLIGNMRASGLMGGSRPYEGVYAAAFEREQIVGVVAHYWNGNLVLQAPDHLNALCKLAIESSGRSLRGLVGPKVQVAEAVEALCVDRARIHLDETEFLYSLALTDLVVPEGLCSGWLRGRRIEPGDLDLVAAWRVDFAVEALGEEESPHLWERCRAAAERNLQQGRTWLLEDQGVPVSTSSFNTAIQEAVQIGGVWTPPKLRSQGYGRAVVAASLLDARAEGVATSILFTGVENIAAQRAYEALGYRRIGDYRIMLLRPPRDG
jgi:RimJ/RimL family protein N-acetyltransferase